MSRAGKEPTKLFLRIRNPSFFFIAARRMQSAMTTLITAQQEMERVMTTTPPAPAALVVEPPSSFASFFRVMALLEAVEAAEVSDDIVTLPPRDIAPAAPASAVDIDFSAVLFGDPADALT
jgi:hypothetical protein